MIKCAAVSDVHGDWDWIEKDVREGGDILFVAGDLTHRGARFEMNYALEQISTTKFAHKVVIAGNHDSCLQKMAPADVKKMFKSHGVHYLQDELLELSFRDRVVSIYGTPWTPKYGIFAFQGSEELLAQQFIKIPQNLDILITHSPPYGIRDRNSEGQHCGSKSLRKIIHDLKPRVHIFGHIHESVGTEDILGVHYRNVAVEGNYLTEPCIYFEI